MNLSSFAIEYYQKREDYTDIIAFYEQGSDALDEIKRRNSLELVARWMKGKDSKKCSPILKKYIVVDFVPFLESILNENDSHLHEDVWDNLQIYLAQYQFTYPSDDKLGAAIYAAYNITLSDEFQLMPYSDQINQKLDKEVKKN